VGRLHAADLFCGAGVTSIGAELSGAARVRFAVNHCPSGEASAFLRSYYGNGDCTGLSSPVPTIVTKDRHSLVKATAGEPTGWPEPDSEAMGDLQRTMRSLGLSDIGLRMLANHELAAAQGFPDDYIFSGNKSQVTKQIGNSVSPPVAKAITESLVA
jgi:DNA (cytosine-5)-methyltransferase 1